MAKENALLFQEVFYPNNPLLGGLKGVQVRIAHFKERVKEFYFRVLLSQYECPKCGGELAMTGPRQCACACGNVFDPTPAFQQSSCCGARLIRKTFHYVCTRCHETVPSRFLFDERVFDPVYFREMMREARARAKRKKEELRKFLAGTRSGPLVLAKEPCLESIPGLREALDGFIGSGVIDFAGFLPKAGFSMKEYRDHILGVLAMGSRLFSEIRPLSDDSRRDKIWRSITLIFMTQDREVELTQFGADILVEMVASEAHF